MSATAANRSRRIIVVLVLNGALIAGEVTSGLLARSTALLADAGHNLADVAGLILALGSLRLALHSPTAQRSFGYLRATILAGIANLLLVVLVAIAIAIDAIDRIVRPTGANGTTMAIVAGVAVIVNFASAVLVFERSRDLNMRSLLVHFGGDVVASGGVLVAGLVIALTGRFALIDPAVSLGIAVLIAVIGVRVGRDSLGVLLEAAPTDIDIAALSSVMGSVDGVAEVHDLHCWSLSSDVRAVSAHVVLDGNPSLVDAQSIGDAVKAAIGPQFHITHATLELESSRCVEDGEDACVIHIVATG